MVVQSHRGEELAEFIGVLTPEQEIEYRAMKTVAEHGEGPVRGGDPVVTDLSFVRLPTDEDLSQRDEYEAENMETLRAAAELIEMNKLDVKLVDAEMLLGRKKLFFYFTADQRVDFRALVKDLARRFRTRIELRQMGVRDEARIIKGMSSCGLPCCCSYWLNKLAPIGIKMVKEQNIALNPAKISGICGRLMCCMAFEHKTYKDLWTGIPGPGSKIRSPLGNYVVMSMDIAREAVRCHKPEGGDLLVPIDLFEEFRTAVMNGEEWTLPEDAISEYDRRKAKCDKCGAAIDAFDFSQFQGASRQEKPDGSPARDEGSRDPHRRRRRHGKGHKPQGQTQEQSDAQKVELADERTPTDGPQKNRPRRRRRRGGPKHDEKQSETRGEE